jgi:hypothetical protein
MSTWFSLIISSTITNMTKEIAANALIPNPALKPFEALIGEWQTTGSHPYFPGMVLHGRAVIEWVEGGAFLRIRAQIDHPDFPDGIQIVGSDDALNQYYLLHFDERGVSRKYDAMVADGKFTWWRNDPEFSQRFCMTIEEGGKKMSSTGEMSKDGEKWEGDLALVYERV